MCLYEPPIFRLFIYIKQPGFLLRKPDSLLKETRPKADRLVCSYLTANKSILFKTFKTRQSRVEIVKSVKMKVFQAIFDPFSPVFKPKIVKI